MADDPNSDGYDGAKIMAAKRRAKNRTLLAIGIFVAAIVLIGPISVHLWPQYYNPAVELLLNLFLTMGAGVFGFLLDSLRSQGKANGKWLPAAESIVNGLLTLQAQVRSMRDDLTCNCLDAEREMPELKEPAFKTVKVWLRKDCSERAKQLDLVVEELDNVIDDWERFIQDNCADDECSRISEKIDVRRSQYREKQRQQRKPEQPSFIPEEVLQMREAATDQKRP